MEPGQNPPKFNAQAKDIEPDISTPAPEMHLRPDGDIVQQVNTDVDDQQRAKMNQSHGVTANSKKAQAFFQKLEKDREQSQERGGISD